MIFHWPEEHIGDLTLSPGSNVAGLMRDGKRPKTVTLDLADVVAIKTGGLRYLISIQLCLRGMESS